MALVLEIFVLIFLLNVFITLQMERASGRVPTDLSSKDWEFIIVFSLFFPAAWLMFTIEFFKWLSQALIKERHIFRGKLND